MRVDDYYQHSQDRLAEIEQMMKSQEHSHAYGYGYLSQEFLSFGLAVQLEVERLRRELTHQKGINNERSRASSLQS